jgi:hypothetical protein
MLVSMWVSMLVSMLVSMWGSTCCLVLSREDALLLIYFRLLQLLNFFSDCSSFFSDCSRLLQQSDFSEWINGPKSQAHHFHCDLLKSTLVGLARTIYIRCIYGMFGREITKYIRFWPTLHTGHVWKCQGNSPGGPVLSCPRHPTIKKTHGKLCGVSI